MDHDREGSSERAIPYLGVGQTEVDRMANYIRTRYATRISDFSWYAQYSRGYWTYTPELHGTSRADLGESGTSTKGEGKTRKHIAVLAGNHKEYENYVRAYYVPAGQDQPFFIEITDTSSISGHRFHEVQKIGSYLLRRNIAQLEEMLFHAMRYEQYETIHAETEDTVAKKKISPGEARAFMREMAAVLEQAQKLEDKYGADGNDGAVITFTKQFLPAYPQYQDTPRPSAAIWNVLDQRPLEDMALIANAPRSFSYAGIRAAGKWWLTGGHEDHQGMEWEDLLQWLEDGVPVHEVTWLLQGSAGELEPGEESTEEGEQSEGDDDSPRDIDVTSELLDDNKGKRG